ncbi:unnamed protein product [Clonostachys rhizophaga]|uniref:Uncharacterized protein n=1 Tax=Clonostachys rhizophaga TaxID=160324 RepID=A0A9N9V700_9HYPO|nr:unnamed protein product [Clonostachys rhizophaga]
MVYGMVMVMVATTGAEMLPIVMRWIRMKMRPPPVRTVPKRGKESYREMIHRAVETGSSKQVIQPLELPTDVQPSTNANETSPDGTKPTADGWSGGTACNELNWQEETSTADTTSGWDVPNDCDEVEPVQSTDSGW